MGIHKCMHDRHAWVYLCVCMRCVGVYVGVYVDVPVYPWVYAADACMCLYV